MIWPRQANHSFAGTWGHLCFPGGETIGKIFKAPGAHVHKKLNRNIPESLSTKYFIIQGTDQQIEPLHQLIREKIEGGRGGRGDFNEGGGQNWSQQGWNQ